MIPVYDMEGNIYKSIKEAARILKIDYSSARRRIHRNYPVDFDITCNNSQDHTGRKFKSFIAMCRFWNKTYEMVSYRLDTGWPLELALTAPANHHYKRSFRRH